MPIDVIFDLFNRTIAPIMNYGCDVWGHGMTEMASKVQSKFYKLVLRLRQSTPTLMVHGEVGKYPIEVLVKCRFCFG